MKVLVANLGSTSFKYRLFDMASETQLARGGVERIGESVSPCFVEIGENRNETEASIADHAIAVKQCLAQLTEPGTGCLEDASEVSAIGFKAVHGGRISGVHRVTEKVLDAMSEMNGVAPAHNPPYINAMRILSEKLPQIPLVAAFETGFHQTNRDSLQYYGIPFEWAEDYQIKRWGFHGASHRYIAERMADLLGREDARIISCHLGGSSSLCAIRNRKSVMTTMGMSPQTGLLHNNRCGDFDAYAISLVMNKTGLSFDQVIEVLASQSGLLGISGVSGDVRDLEAAAEAGNERAQLAIEVFVNDIRRYLGSLLIELGGLDALVFTGGIGQNGNRIRKSVCNQLLEFGIELCDQKNDSPNSEEFQLQTDNSKVQIWVVPTNEELVVARQTKE
ncbi:MAG: acetate/propionate family kinase, partial [Planctomycetota bacterium]|nr:acetate/propionate family kinase [Planctomycetota bacterium]